ncbi:MAG: PP2C family protein-serine/threonine phosphatase, partial [Flavobacteriales bacterium]
TLNPSPQGGGTSSPAEKSFYLAVCDSTGHGVPGAFMSLLNISFLNEAINEKGIEAPNEVFNHVRKRLIENVSHEGAQDGMDATLIKFQALNSKFQIEYAAAHHSPVVIRNGKCIDLPFDKMPIGKGESTANFKLYTFELEKGDMLYLYTDGYADQFGGPKGKKFKESNLKNLFLDIHARSSGQQRDYLLNELMSWMQGHEQIDDVCIVGIKF